MHRLKEHKCLNERWIWTIGEYWLKLFSDIVRRQLACHCRICGIAVMSIWYIRTFLLLVLVIHIGFKLKQYFLNYSSIACAYMKYITIQIIFMYGTEAIIYSTIISWIQFFQCKIYLLLKIYYGFKLTNLSFSFFQILSWAEIIKVNKIIILYRFV